MHPHGDIQLGQVLAEIVPGAMLGKAPEAAQALTELLQVRPDFTEVGGFLLGCYAKFPDLVEGLLDGLRLAGLTI
jgi:hypothetical protein